MIADRIASLSPRQYQVLDLMVEGHQNIEIGHELGISPRTVEIHRGHVMKKMKAKTTGELFRMVLTGGINPLRRNARAVQEYHRERIEARHRVQDRINSLA